MRQETKEKKKKQTIRVVEGRGVCSEFWNLAAEGEKKKVGVSFKDGILLLLARRNPGEHICERWTRDEHLGHKAG